MRGRINLKKSSIILLFIGSITLNAFGNSCMIVAHIGSATWAAACLGLASISPFSTGVWTIILQVLTFLAVYFMGSRFNLLTITYSLALAFLYGLLLDLFIHLHTFLYIPDSLSLKWIYTLIGMNFISVAVSIYIQLGTVLMPFDYLLQAFAKLTRSFTVGTIFCLMIPLSISIIISIIQQQIIGVGIATVLFVFLNGILIDIYNRFIIINHAGRQKTPA